MWLQACFTLGASRVASWALRPLSNAPPVDAHRDATRDAPSVKEASTRTENASFLRVDNAVKRVKSSLWIEKFLVSLRPTLVDNTKARLPK